MVNKDIIFLQGIVWASIIAALYKTEGLLCCSWFLCCDTNTLCAQHPPGPACTLYSWSLGSKGNQCKHESWYFLCHVSHPGVSESGVLCLLSESMKLWQITLLACKEDKIRDPSQFFTDICRYLRSCSPYSSPTFSFFWKSLQHQTWQISGFATTMGFSHSPLWLWALSLFLPLRFLSFFLLSCLPTFIPSLLSPSFSFFLFFWDLYVMYVLFFFLSSISMCLRGKLYSPFQFNLS